MSRTRRTEQRTLQDLGLIRDERDREVERAARSRGSGPPGAGPALSWSPSPC